MATIVMMDGVPDENAEVIELLGPCDEKTLALYRLGRLVISRVAPERLAEFPEFDYTPAQESKMFVLLAELCSLSHYQEI